MPHYYQPVLATGADVNATEILQFNVTSTDGSQSNITNHTVKQDEVNFGGLFNFNITLAPGGVHDINCQLTITRRQWNKDFLQWLVNATRAEAIVIQ